VELPTSHRVPLSWLLEHGGDTIRYRTLKEIAPPGAAPADAIISEVAQLAQFKGVAAIVKRQKESGIWGANLLATGPSVKDGIKEAGTVPQYRRLLQLGLPTDHRAYRLAERLLFRLLSRDEDPALLQEFQKLAKAEPLAIDWVRGVLREASTAALAEAGHIEDPRIRGAAHKIASAISEFLRSPLAAKPFMRSGANTILNPEAYPPTWYSLAMMAAMPNLQRSGPASPSGWGSTWPIRRRRRRSAARFAGRACGGRRPLFSSALCGLATDAHRTLYDASGWPRPVHHG